VLRAGHVAQFGSGIFLVIQMVILLDFVQVSAAPRSTAQKSWVQQLAHMQYSSQAVHIYSSTFPHIE